MKLHNTLSTNLFPKSKDIILENQSSTGAYMASPNFPRYRYCWFRDGSYVAYAMDIIGEDASSQKFHDWAATTINKHSDKSKQAIKKNNGGKLSSMDVLHTRYTMEGEVVDHKWANFQLDGFGTWLWSLNEHVSCRNFRPLPASWKQAVKTTRDYLIALWSTPNYDCWEENQDKIHPYTLAAICAGLQAADTILGEDTTQETQETIKDALFTKGVYEGHFVKSFGLKEIDTCLIGISTPYRVIDPNDSIMIRTVAEVEAGLRRENGGVHRYKKDTYYGGGEWILLTAWLGWYYIEIGNRDKAINLLHWIERQADENLFLPEQVPTNVYNRKMYDKWIKNIGNIANPLLWSHAMYIILYKSLQNQ